MKLKTVAAMLLFGSASVFAQTDDPVIMNIAGQDIKRSEFEYSYKKNNSEGVIDKKTVDEYVDLFVNYKLKVQAAVDEHMDTLSSYKKEFRQYRDQQIRPSFINDADVEAEAHRIYDAEAERVGSVGFIQTAHILIRLSPNADKATEAAAKARVDSIYDALQHGADFTELATTKSEDPASAARGGLVGWVSRGQTVKEFEDALTALPTGEISKPVLSPFGWHIIKAVERRQMEPFDSVRNNIMTFIERRNIREQIIDRKLQAVAEASNGKTAEEILDEQAEKLQAEDSDLANLVREYHDGLLLYEISNREVWEKGAKDEAGLTAFFKKNKKNYKWDEPRFKGMAYHVKDKNDVKAVANSVKGLKFEDWNEKLRTTFNGDSIIRIRVEKGLFKKGDNALVDSCIFKVADAKVKHLKEYPIDATYGKKIKAPQEMADVRAQVTADYQAMLEKEWVAGLRRKYVVTVNPDVVATVRKRVEEQK